MFFFFLKLGLYTLSCHLSVKAKFKLPFEYPCVWAKVVCRIFSIKRKVHTSLPETRQLETIARQSMSIYIRCYTVVVYWCSVLHINLQQVKNKSFRLFFSLPSVRSWMIIWVSVTWNIVLYVINLFGIDTGVIFTDSVLQQKLRRNNGDCIVYGLNNKKGCIFCFVFN